jgi:hypothetical protein
MSNLRNKDVVVHANKTSNNVVCICKSHYIDCLIKELCIENSLGNLAYAQSTHTKWKSWKIIGLLCVLLEIQIQPMDFPLLYYISKLHKCPYEQRYMDGSAKCSTKPLSKLLLSNLIAVKIGLQSYCDTIY